MKFLVIEDNYVNAKLMEKLLKKYGEVDIALDGTKGIELFEQSIMSKEKYEIIFLDIMMPNIDGYKVLKSIKNIEYSNDIDEPSKVVMTTALDDFKSVKTAFDEQCEAYLIKPISKEKIKDIFLKFDITV